MHKKVKVACRCMVAPFAQLEAPQDPLELSRHTVRSDHLVHQPGSPEVDVVITNCRKNCVASEGSKNPTYELSECQKSCPPKKNENVGIFVDQFDGPTSWQGITITHTIDRQSTSLSRSLGRLCEERSQAQQVLTGFSATSV